MERLSRFFLYVQAIQWHQNQTRGEDNGTRRTVYTLWRAGFVSVWDGPDE